MMIVTNIEVCRSIEINVAIYVYECVYIIIVWNHTNDERIVLLFDLWHPELESSEITAITEMFEYAKQQGWLSKPTSK